jgi:hypothetical protein
MRICQTVARPLAATRHKIIPAAITAAGINSARQPVTLVAKLATAVLTRQEIQEALPAESMVIRLTIGKQTTGKSTTAR